MTGIHRSRSVLITCAMMLSAIAISGCKGGGGGSDASASATGGAPAGGATTTSNSAPTISGSASTKAAPNQSYSFVPKASDADGDTVSFQIANKPAWATFSTVTGELSGTAVTGTFADIVISASDGKSSSALAPFSIAVTANAVALPKSEVTLSWVAPTQNSDGSILTNFAGYIISFGTSEEALSESVRIDNPSIDRYVFDALAKGTYYFGLRSIATNGELSELSQLVKKVVQ